MKKLPRTSTPSRSNHLERISRAFQSELIGLGATEVRPGVWVSNERRIFSDEACSQLKEFNDPQSLRKLLADDACWHIYISFMKQGYRFIKFFGNYVEIFLPRKGSKWRKWKIQSNARLAQKVKSSRLFQKGYADVGRVVRGSKRWIIDGEGKVETVSGARNSDWLFKMKMCWNGRFHPSTAEVSVEPPKSYKGPYIPSPIISSLHLAFGTHIDFMDYFHNEGKSRIRKIRS